MAVAATDSQPICPSSSTLSSFLTEPGFCSPLQPPLQQLQWRQVLTGPGPSQWSPSLHHGFDMAVVLKVSLRGLLRKALSWVGRGHVMEMAPFLLPDTGMSASSTVSAALTSCPDGSQPDHVAHVVGGEDWVVAWLQLSPASQAVCPSSVRCP